jgi:hypothetical protein
MKRFGLTFALVAVLALPAAAAAQRPDGERDSTEHCKAARGEPAGSASRRTFGEDRGERGERGECRSERRKPKRLRKRLKEEVFTDAVKECRAEFVADPTAFEEKYGSKTAEVSREDGEGRRSHPFRTCVKLKFKEAIAALRESFENAAKECKAERAEDRAAFRVKYGTNRNRRNALGKCVSRHVKEDVEGDEPGEEGDGERRDEPKGSEERPAPRGDDAEGTGDGKEPVREAPDAGRE